MICLGITAIFQAGLVPHCARWDWRLSPSPFPPRIGAGARHQGHQRGDPVTRTQFINQAIQQGYDGIVISAADADSVVPAPEEGAASKHHGGHLRRRRQRHERALSDDHPDHA